MQAWKLQDEIMMRLDAECASGRIHHTYLFEGRPGMGKRELALEFAKKILCLGDCGESQCNSCRKVDSGYHPDVILVEPKDGKILAEALREYVKSVLMPPFESKKKVYILDGFDLVAPEIQNMLLKSLEEPAHYVVNLLLASNTEKILPTILSRCSIFKLKPVGKSVLQQHLEESYHLLPDRASYLATLSGGALKYAEQMAEQSDFFDTKSILLESFTSFLQGREEELIRLADMLEEEKEGNLPVPDMLLVFLKDVLAMAGGVSEGVSDSEAFPHYRVLSKLSTEQLERYIFAVEEVKRHQKANVGVRNAWYALMG